MQGCIFKGQPEELSITSSDQISVSSNGTDRHPVSRSDTLRRTQTSLLAENVEPGFNQGETPGNPDGRTL